MADLHDYMSVTEAAQSLDVTRQTVYDWCGSYPWRPAKLRAIMVSDRVMVLREDVAKARRERETM